MFNICLCARFQSKPREFHLIAIKRIFRYLSGTINLGLYFKQGKTFRLISYCDADYASDKLERKSTNGSGHFIDGNLASWI